MLITNATLDGLRTQFEMKFQAAYDTTPVWHPPLTTVVPSGAKSNTYGWAAQQTRMREWLGPRVALNLSEHAYTISNRDYEATVELDRNEIEDDSLGIFTAATIPDLAQAAKKHPDTLMQSMLQLNSGAGPIAFDGKNLFADDHPTYDVTGTTTTYDNKFAVALTADNFEIVWAAMASYVGENGYPLGIMPGTLIVPPQLRRTALAIVKASSNMVTVTGGAAPNIAASSVDNVMQGWADVIVVPEFANDPTRWYLADCTRAIKPLILQNRRADQFISRDNPQDPKVFDQKKFTYGVDNRRNVGVSLPFLIATSKP